MSGDPCRDGEAPVVEAAGLRKVFTRPRLLPWLPPETFTALDGVDLAVPRGGALGLVGESGSGKTTLGRVLLRLAEPTAGRVLFRGGDGVEHDVTAADGESLRRLRRRMQIVFQDPYHSLNPARTAGEIVAEGLMIHEPGSRRQHAARARDWLARVGLPRDAADRRPQEFSGGQRQRIALARALALAPEFLVCDEITSALDTRTQAQVLELIAGLQQELRLALLFISHDLATVARVCDRVVVLHRGRVVEEGRPAGLFRSPREDYTRQLVAALPSADPRRRTFRRSAAAPNPAP